MRAALLLFVATIGFQAQTPPSAGKTAPPMTADDKELQPHMKKLVSAYVGMRGDIEKADREALSAHLTTIKTSLKDVETFFATRQRQDAAKLAAAAIKRAEAVEEMTDWDAIKAGRLALNQSCETCHSANRDRYDDGGFRIKPSDQ